jgi:hypothetical protein
VISAPGWPAIRPSTTAACAWPTNRPRAWPRPNPGPGGPYHGQQDQARNQVHR